MKISPHKSGTTIHLVVFQWIRRLKKPSSKILRLRLLVALKRFSTKKVPCQGIIIQPITEHLTLDNSDTW